MYDAELLELAAAPEELTDQARQVLGDEVRKRGLDGPRAAAAPGPLSDASDVPEGEEDGEPQREYTWKTPLCGCETQAAALQLSEALRRAGIENWIARPGAARYAMVWDEQMAGNLQILVAADQLDEAREVAAKPIPKEIVEESQIEAPEYELPVCPRCGAADPVLEDVDPVNRWQCEACGNEWAETEESSGNGQEKGKF
jgi:ribosomal protein S27AE